MSLRSLPAGITVALCMLLAGSHPAQGAPPSPEKTVGTDAYGDQLPVGAVARLGTERLCHAGVYFLAFSPDGTRLASVAHDGTVRLWQVDTGKELRQFQAPRFMGYGTDMSPLTFSPDGKLLVLGCADKSLHVWDVTTGKEVQKFAGLPLQPSNVTFSPDGKTLVAGCGNGSILLLDPLKGKEIDRLEGFISISQVALADEGKTLVALGRDSRSGSNEVVRHFDIAKRAELSRLQLDRDSRYGLALSPDGKTLAAPTDDGKCIRLMDPATGKEICRTEKKDADPAVISFTSDGSLFAAAGNDGRMLVYETAKGTLRHEFLGHTAYVQRVALSPDGKLLASSAPRQDDGVHLWDVAKGKEVHTFTGHRSGPLTVAFLSNGRTVVTTSRDASHNLPMSDWADWSLRQWDAASGEELRAEKASQAGEIHWTVFSDDGSRLATVRQDGTLRLWDVSKTQFLREWKIPALESTITQGKRVDKVSWPNLTGLTLSADGRTIVTAGEEKVLRFWDGTTGTEIRKQQVTAGPVRQCLLSPDDRILAVVVDEDRLNSVISLLDSRTGEEVRTFPPIRGRIGALAFTADGTALAMLTNTETIVGEIATGGFRAKYDGDFRYGSGLALSPDGRVVATAGLDNVIHLWADGGDKPIGTLAGHRKRIDSPAFSPDGKKLASAGYENFAYVWDVAEVLRGKLPAPAKLGPKDLEALWDSLAERDAAKAYRARNTLLAGATESLPWLRKKVEAFPAAPDPANLSRLVKDLDAESSEDRLNAVDALLELGAWEGPAVRKALAFDKTSAKAGRLAAEIVRRLDEPSAQWLRQIRTLELLEQIGTPESRQVLEKLAAEKGARQATVKACLERLKRRGVDK
jgi:WD40 repeat protein